MNPVAPIEILLVEDDPGDVLMTQEAFAHHLGVSVSSVRDWEQDRRRPRGLYAKLLREQMAAQVAGGKAAA